MKKNHIIFLTFISLLLIVGAFYFYKSNQKQLTSKKHKEDKTVSKIIKNTSQQKEDTKKRTPATSITRPSKDIKREIKGEWKDKAIKRLAHNLSEDYKISIEAMAIKKIPQGDLSFKEVQEAVVSITHPSGAKSSYSALIDPQTGSIIETFNHPQYENRDFYAVKLKADYNTLKLVPLNKKKQ